MAQVGVTLATALQADSTKAVARPASAAQWPEQGRTVTALSPFATEAGGAAEAERLATLFGTPVVVDRAVVMGQVRGLLKRCVRLFSTDLDYRPEGELVIVLRLAEQDNGTTVMTVLRRLA